MNLLKFTAIICVLLAVILIPGCGMEYNGTDPCNTHRGTDDYLLLYKDVLDDYEKIVDFRLAPNFEDDYNSDHKPILTKEWTNCVLLYDGVELEKNDASYRWNCMLIDMLDYTSGPTKESFGYIITDLSDDGIPELVWVNADYRILCIFTIVDNQVCLVDSFWSRYSCIIQETGELYILKNGGAADNTYVIKRIDSELVSLISQIEFGEKKGMYYRKEDDQYCVLTENEYKGLFNKYPFAINDKWKENTIHFLAP